jgi:hypothetical protein
MWTIYTKEKNHRSLIIEYSNSEYHEHDSGNHSGARSGSHWDLYGTNCQAGNQLGLVKNCDTMCDWFENLLRTHVIKISYHFWNTEHT